jgi:ribosomal protein S18 acetylase RimI-like enzyme
MATMRIRIYQPGDEAAFDNICLRTGNRGEDGEPFYQQDPDALGRIYVKPYLAFEPDFAWVLEDKEGVCGYALGALDSHNFYDRYEQEWRPGLCEKFAMPSGDPKFWSRVEHVYQLYHHPNYTCAEPYDDYPSHLHINLLAQAQGQGCGRKLMQQFLQRLKHRGSPGVHLKVGAMNKRAYGFYRAIGFQELSRQGAGIGESICMGLKLG